MSFAHLKRGAFSTVVKHHAKAATFLFLLPATFDFFSKNQKNRSSLQIKDFQHARSFTGSKHQAISD